MISWKVYIVVIVSFSSLHARLVFNRGSDVGYIVPDEIPEDDYDDKIEKDYLQESKIKNEVKRAFWNTFLDDISELEKGETSIHSLRNSRASKSLNHIPEKLKDTKHGVIMGISDYRCDDAKTKLEMDWDGSPRNYTCYTPKNRLEVRLDLQPLEACDTISPDYMPTHFCMDSSIVYNVSIPTFGSHRPLWPIFGEYQFVPPQRWLHSIEHGSVVMLYHPCAEPLLVNRLKTLVKECVYKHIITPSNMVSIDRPLVLVAWGCKLEMAVVDEEGVVEFIRRRALHGPEGTLSKQGSFSEGLRVKSVPPSGSDVMDSSLCPSFV